MSNQIVICMGSSCFARGNEKNLRIIEEFLQNRGAGIDVQLSGSCCEGKCSVGPNVVINGEIFHNVDAGTMIDLLNTKLIK